MNIETVLSLLLSIISTIAAILAWVAKIRWSSEYTAAKDEIVKAKEAQIDSLKNEIRFLQEINSPKIHEYYSSVKSELEDFIDIKDRELEIAQDELQQKEDQIKEMQYEWETQKTNIEWELNSGITFTLEGWAQSVEMRGGETEGHTHRVTNMTLKLAQVMGLPEEKLIHIKRGALLHDVGKIGIPDSILHKPGALTDEEFTLLKQHPVYSYELLKGVEYLRPALDIPYCHHEKWDGSGYPRGLKGEEIPLAARIFAIVDVWDSLSADRPYREAISTEKAIKFLDEQSGKHFDPQVVEAFKEIISNTL